LKLLRLLRVTVVLIWKGTPTALRYSMPRRLAANAPGTPRKLSWLAASGPSMEMEQRLTPAALMLAAVSGVMRVPLGEKAQGRPLAWA
jgi:hypothetical protein